MKQSKKPPSLLRYYGIHLETGWHKLRDNSQAAYGIGTLAPIGDFTSANASEDKAAGRLVHCSRSGQYFRFVGALLPTPKALAVQVLSALAVEANRSHATPASARAAASSDAGARRPASGWFDKELARTEAMRSAGVDPYVGMRFLVPYLGESRPSLSRKFGKELAAPVKRGGRNFWLLSEVDAYASGKQVAANLPPSGDSDATEVRP